MTAILMFLSGGFARLIDGSTQPMPGLSFSIPNGVRVAVMGALCCVSWVISCGYTVAAAWGAVWCILAIVVGHTDWQDWLWQPLRFGLFGFAAAFLTPEMWTVPSVMALGGLFYPVLFWVDDKIRLPRCWIVDGPEAYGRVFSGGICISAPLW